MVAVAAGLGLLAANWLLPEPGTTPSSPTVSARPAPAPALTPGDPLPTLQLRALDGSTIDLQQFRGRPLLVNVWASWCAPCVEEMPELARFAAAQPHDGVQVLGLALDEQAAVQDFLQRVPVGYPIAIDTPGPADASVALGNARGLLPYTVLFDAQGRMVKSQLGPFEHGQIERWVKQQ